MKRIVGLPGETVQIRRRGGGAHVYIDGRRLREPYIDRDSHDIGPPKAYDMPQGSYFVMGDNRSHSCDSRARGTVPRGNFIGPVVVRYWPLDRIRQP